jgi:RHS repeat-associated protein
MGSNVYNAANQLLEDDTYIYSYDRNGNTISKTNKVTGEYTRYYWNAENQMTMIEEYSTISSSTPVSVSSYIYDGLGRRVAKNIDGVITKYIYDQEDILLEMDETDNILARYTHGPGIDEPIIMERNGASYYYVADGLGSIVKLVDAAGATVNNYVYDSFGNMLEKTEGVANPYTYTAREYDAESGLYYYRTRYYDARIGRFISEDPIGFWGGIDFYLYAGANPIRWLDPFGLDEITDDPVVRNAFEKAWEDSQAYDPDKRHEEGGWISKQNRKRTIQRWPSGKTKSIVIEPPIIDPEASFHTHPNPPPEWRQEPRTHLKSIVGGGKLWYKWQEANRVEGFCHDYTGGAV